MVPQGVGHFQGNVSGQRAYWIENAPGKLNDVSAHHQDGHRFANGAAETKHERGKYSGAGGGQNDSNCSLTLRCAQCERSLAVDAGNNRLQVFDE